MLNCTRTNSVRPFCCRTFNDYLHTEYEFFFALLWKCSGWKKKERKILRRVEALGIWAVIPVFFYVYIYSLSIHFEMRRWNGTHLKLLLIKKEGHNINALIWFTERNNLQGWLFRLRFSILQFFLLFFSKLKFWFVFVFQWWVCRRWPAHQKNIDNGKWSLLYRGQEWGWLKTFVYPYIDKDKNIDKYDIFIYFMRGCHTCATVHYAYFDATNLIFWINTKQFELFCWLLMI